MNFQRCISTLVLALCLVTGCKKEAPAKPAAPAVCPLAAAQKTPACTECVAAACCGTFPNPITPAEASGIGCLLNCEAQKRAKGGTMRCDDICSRGLPGGLAGSASPMTGCILGSCAGPCGGP